jgi:nucleotide-binding universal stress UspA family protein
VDFSERSVLLKSEVENLAKRFGAKVTILHVFEIPAAWYGTTAEAPTINMQCFQVFADVAKANLANFNLDLPAGRVEKVLVEGDPAWQIGNWVRHHPTDLVMMGTRGYGKLQGLLLGSVAAKVMHDAQCPVWSDAGSSFPKVVPKNIDNVLCAVDIDAETVPLLRFAHEVSRLFSAKLRVLHCVSEAETRPNKYFDFDLHRYLLESARIELTKLEREAGTHCEISILSGSIAKAVRNLAVQTQTGLVILGKGKSHNVLGRLRTHAYQIIHDSPCPVLSYSPAQPDHTSSSCSEEHLYQSVKPVPPQIGSSPI